MNEESISKIDLKEDSGEAVSAVETAPEPKEFLRPESTTHERLLTYLRRRIRSSERSMENFHPRWRVNERRLQAYISLPDYEQILKSMNDERCPPKAVSIAVPYSFATIQTIVTYIVQTFCGRRPMWQVSSLKGSTVNAAANMELLLQYNSDVTQMVKVLWQYILDGESYGVQVLRTAWQSRKEPRTVVVQEPRRFLGVTMPGMTQAVRRKELRTVFEGTDCLNIDPFMFFPDPRVPMTEVSRRGEFVFWRTFEGRHSLKVAEADGLLFYVDQAGQAPPSKNLSSDRNLLSRGESHPGLERQEYGLGQNVQVDQGSVTIIPSELGLGPSSRPEKWLFTILNDKQVVQAVPLDNDHGEHPVVVGEPYSMGYGFGQPAMADYMGGLEDTQSWLINSHIHNVRTSLNNMWLVDPSMVELGDLKNPEPGKLIRLKRAAFGRDIRTMLQQLQVSDVTRAHMTDLPAFMRLADTLSAVTDNVRGLQDAGGRKTATEARIGADAASSRLAAHARLISGQSLSLLTRQMSLNYQQYLSEEFEFLALGPDGVQASVRATPEMLAGDFHFPIHDGTLPLDKVALLDVWKEIFMAVSQDPQLRSGFDIFKLFGFIAELSGAKNIDDFKIQAGSPEALAAQAQSGNVVPIGGAGGQDFRAGMPGGAGVGPQ